MITKILVAGIAVCLLIGWYGRKGKQLPAKEATTEIVATSGVSDEGKQAEQNTERVVSTTSKSVTIRVQGGGPVVTIFPQSQESVSSVQK